MDISKKDWNNLLKETEHKIISTRMALAILNTTLSLCKDMTSEVPSTDDLEVQH